MAHQNARGGVAVQLLASVALLTAHGSVAAEPPQDVFWLQAKSGLWIEPAKWSTKTYYPQNGVPNPDDTYRVIINAAGTAYEIAMENKFATYELDGFVLDSAAATLHHYDGLFRPKRVELRAGTYYFNSFGTLGTVEDALIDILPGARVDFATDTGSPKQPTGCFRRCTINGNLTLSRHASGVLFEESVVLNGDIRLEAPSCMVAFSGGSFTFDGSAITAAQGGTIGLSVPSGFTLGQSGRVLGSFFVESRMGSGLPFRNEGRIEFFETSAFRDLAVDNRSRIEVSGRVLGVDGERASFANHGVVQINAGAAMVVSVQQSTPMNAGLISLAAGSIVATLYECRLASDSVIEIALRHGDKAGMLDLADFRYQSELDGTLRIVTDDPLGFVAGDRFRLVQCENFIGGFSSYELAPIGNGLVIQIEVVPADGVFAVVRCRADINRDGIVGVDDYSDFVELFDVADPGADVNGDGFVNGNDYDEFADHFDVGC